VLRAVTGTKPPDGGSCSEVGIFDSDNKFGADASGASDQL
jgi:hypothetical protein